MPRNQAFLLTQAGAPASDVAVSETPLTRLSEAVEREIRGPGVMRLSPVYLDGQVADFELGLLTPRAAALLGQEPTLSPVRLSDLLNSTPTASDLCATYLRVFSSQIEEVFLSETTSPSYCGGVRHHIIRTATGLSVMLIPRVDI